MEHMHYSSRGGDDPVFSFNSEPMAGASGPLSKLRAAALSYYSARLCEVSSVLQQNLRSRR